MFKSNAISHVWIICAAVITVCTCTPLPCTHQDKCSSYEIKDNQSRCKDLEAYIKCMKLLSKQCRGDIGYHSAMTVSNSEFKRNCMKVGNNTNEHSQSIVPSIHNGGDCSLFFDDKKEHRFCGLFGDPHLRTFDGRYQTCRIHGAWQVIENRFFGIMVTDESVMNSTTATAPTKLSVILKHVPKCNHQQLLYVAQGDAQLPTTFNGGTSPSQSGLSPGVSLSWRLNDNDSETVIIRLSYISTIISITRVGKYLSVSAKLPDELAQTFNQEKNELCSSGCPTSEQIDIKQVTITELDRVLNLCHNSIGPTGHRLTDQYLDWCVFDMMASHDEQFINASHAAYSDVLFFEPRSLFNRTISVFESNPTSTDSACCTNRLHLFILIIITLYNFLRVFLIL